MYMRTLSASHQLRRLLISAALSFIAISICGRAFAEDPAAMPKEDNVFRARPVLGLPNTHSGAPGSLSVRQGLLRFENTKNEVTLLSVISVEAVLLSEQDKQVGGVPMMLGKAAVPFAGGRVVSLISHKKYDDIAIVYRDDNGGIHGVIFELHAGQGLKLQELLVGQGARRGPQPGDSGRINAEVGDARN